MAALPKRKPSSRRQGRRRATHKINLVKPVKCPQCGQDKEKGLACKDCLK